MTIVAEQVIDTLVDLGVDAVFTLCGNHVLPLYEVLRSRDVRVVDTRSEAAAVMAADAYARTSRRPGVALVTGGPGFTNTLTGILTAAGNRSPVVVISGEPELPGRDRGGHQEADIAGLGCRVAKWSRAVVTPGAARPATVEAFRMALGGAPGPVVLSLPLDIQRAPASTATALTSTAFPQPGVASEGTVDAAAALLRKARRPAVIARAGAWQGGGERALARLAEARLPIFTLDSARGIVPDDHPSAFGYADPTLNPAAALLGEADVVVVLGNELDFRLQHGALFAEDAAIVHVDEDLSALGRTREPAVACCAAPAAFADSLAARLDGVAPEAAWLEQLTEAYRAGRDVLAELSEDHSVPFHPAAVAAVLARVGDAAEATYVFDCGEFVQWCRQAITASKPGRWLRLGPQSTCGAGLPFGLGAKTARPDGPVMVIAGDGGIGYHIAEIETAVRRSLPVTVVVGQDHAWGVERNLQIGVYGREGAYASDLGPTDFAQVAEGFGGHGRSASTLEELERATAEALRSRAVTLVQVPVRAEPSAVTRALISRERAAMGKSTA